MNSQSAIELTVYVRTYCHLCEEMLVELGRHREVLGFRLTVIDIEDNQALEALYGEKIPVLKADEHELCHYFLDKTSLYDYIEGTRKSI